MREEPGLPGEWLVQRVRATWGVPAGGIRFLPVGDARSAAYRVDAGRPYFLKLWRRRADEAAAPVALAVPRLLAEQGVAAVIPPVPTRDGQLAAELDGWAATLHPWVEGRSGFECELSDRQWVEFGAALRAVHAVRLPPALAADIPAESYSPAWREAARRYVAAAGRAAPADPIVARLDELLTAQAGRIGLLIARAERLAAVLATRTLPPVLCHADIHAGNVLIADDGRIYLVDWDAPVLAPRERDLMFIGAGIGGLWDTDREAELFYRGYGAVAVDPAAVAYYRYERIVQDVAAFCDEIHQTAAGRAEREQSFAHLAGQFRPGEVIDIACRAGDATVPA